jgi:hypothetical protein
MPISPTLPLNPFAVTGNADDPRELVAPDGGAPASVLSPFAEPAIATPPAPSMPAFDQPPAPTPGRAPSFLGQAMPLLALAMARGNPQVMAAGMSGWMEGKRRKEEAALSLEDRQRKRQLEAAEFYTRAMQSLGAIDDPVVHAQAVAALEPMFKFHGIGPGAVPFNNQKLAEKTKKDAAALLDALDRKHPEGSYTAEWKDPKTGAVRRVTRAELAQIAGQAAFDAQGQALAPSKVPTPRQEPAVGSFEDYVRRTYGEQPTPAQLLQAKKDFGQADDRPRVTTDPEITDLRKQLLQGQVDTATAKATETQAAAGRAKTAARKTAGDTLDVLKQLIDVAPDGRATLKPGVGNLFGARIPGGRYIPGTNTANAASALERLKSRVVVDLLAEMKSQSRTGATGFGALTERELDLLQNAASQLNSSFISDTRAAEELARIYEIASRAYSASSAAAAPTPGPSAGGKPDPGGIRSSGGAKRDPGGIRR